MAGYTLEPAQRTAAKVVGLLYVLTNLSAIFAYYARSQVMARDDIARTAQNLIEQQTLYRLGMLAELLTVAAVLVLVVALYVVLKPVDSCLARVAACWRLTENVILAIIPLGSLTALALLGGANNLQSLGGEQLHGLAYTLLRVHFAAFNFGFLFLGLGSTVFSYIWFKSRYIPRPIAAWGIFSSALMAVATAAIIVKPGLISVLGMAYMAPMGIYEFGLGFWLMFASLRPMTDGVSKPA